MVDQYRRSTLDPSDLVRLAWSDRLSVATSVLVVIRQRSHPPLALPCCQSSFYNVLLIFYGLLLAKQGHSLSVIHGEKCFVRVPLPGNLGEADALDPLTQIRLRALKSARFWQRFCLA